MTPIRPVRPSDREEWIRMRTALWPEWPEDHPPEVDAWLDEVRPDREVIVLEREGEGDATADRHPLGGFVEVELRTWADGCDTSPVGYLEGLWVDEDLRGRGHARHLVEAAEAWARERGCVEMASDAALENSRSIAVHGALGYEEVVRAVLFRKDLDGLKSDLPE